MVDPGVWTYVGGEGSRPSSANSAWMSAYAKENGARNSQACTATRPIGSVRFDAQGNIVRNDATSGYIDLKENT